MKCPICETTIDNVRQTPFCPTCQWELLEIPSNSSNEMKQYFKTLENNFREYYSRITRMTDLSEAVSSLQKSIEVIQRDIDKCNNEIAQEEYCLIQQQKEFDRLQKVQEEITKANQILSENEKEVKKAQKIHNQSQKYDDMLQELLRGFLIVKRRGYLDHSISTIERFLRRKGILND